jgi:hypothetical protein
VVTVASGALWFVLFLIACGLLAAVPRLGPATLKALSLRLSMLVFISAGTVGLSGKIGEGLDWLLVKATHIGNDATAFAIGSAVMWAVWLSLCVVWVAGFLPTKLIRFDPRDELAAAGLILPAVASAIPGGAGDFFQGLFNGIGAFFVDLVTGWFGG